MKPHRVVRTAKTRQRKFNGKCEECGKSVCSCTVYQYTDESNAAITNNSPYLCKECYEKKYGVKILTDVDRYKERLLEALQDYADDGKEITLYRVKTIIKLID